MAGAKSFGEFHYTKIGVKEAGKIVAKGRHNERGRETPNADPARSHENVRLAGSGDWLADVQARADEATFKRANSVLALDVAFFVSKGFFDDKPSAVMDVWARRTMEWMAQEFGGEKNVVAAILHKDETTPHIQALIVPLDEKDRLNARHFIGQPRQVVGLHTSYNKAVADLGLARGVQGSVATHGNIREWYAKIEAPTPARAEVERAVDTSPRSTGSAPFLMMRIRPSKPDFEHGMSLLYMSYNARHLTPGQVVAGRALSTKCSVYAAKNPVYGG